MATMAKVSGLSKSVTEKELSEFFGHSGKISSIEIKTLEDSRIGFVSFEEGDALQSALLLSGSELEGQKIVVDAAEEKRVKAAEGEAEAVAEKSSGTEASPSNIQERAQKMISELLSKGYVLGSTAMLRAREFDDRHQIINSTKSKFSAFGIATKEFASKTSSKAVDMDKKMKISENIANSVEAVNQRVTEVDEKYSLSEKTKGIFERAEKVVSDAISVSQKKSVEAGNAIRKSSYWEKGHTWVVGAVARLSARGRKRAEGEGAATGEEKGAPELKVKDNEAQGEGETAKGEDTKGEEVKGEEVKKGEVEKTVGK